MGGGEVVRYLSRYGTSRVTKAVLVSAVTPFLLKTPDNPEGVDREVFEEIAASIRTLKRTVSDADLDWNQSMALTGSLRSTLAAAKAWSTTDFREEMKQITIPVRIIQGTSDSTVPIDASGRRSAKILPNATLSEYSGEPHGLFLPAADQLNAELLEFIGVA